MSRAQCVVPGRARKKKILKASRGNVSGRSRLYRVAKENILRGLADAYRDRRARKGEFRRLWIARINAAARLNGSTYSQFIAGLKRSSIVIDRKQLSEMAIHDADAFRKLVEEAKANLPSVASSEVEA